MTCKYDKIYLEGVMDSLGAMMDYGVNSLHLTPAEMFSKFISSGIAGYIEHGHPRYLAGLSGVPLRTIRSYEQLSRSLQRAEAGTLQDLSRALGCPMQALLL